MNTFLKKVSSENYIIEPNSAMENWPWSQACALVNGFCLYFSPLFDITLESGKLCQDSIIFDGNNQWSLYVYNSRCVVFVEDFMQNINI